MNNDVSRETSLRDTGGKEGVMGEQFEAPLGGAVRFQPGVRVDITTLARGAQRIHLITCTLCGPVAVDTTGRADKMVALEHLQTTHAIPVPA